MRRVDGRHRLPISEFRSTKGAGGMMGVGDMERTPVGRGPPLSVLFSQGSHAQAPYSLALSSQALHSQAPCSQSPSMQTQPAPHFPHPFAPPRPPPHRETNLPRVPPSSLVALSLPDARLPAYSPSHRFGASLLPGARLCWRLLLIPISLSTSPPQSSSLAGARFSSGGVPCAHRHGASPV